MRTILIFLVGFLVLTPACRKKDFSGTGPDTPFDPTPVPPLFNNAQPALMSDFEVSRNASMNGHLLTKSMLKIGPGDIFGWGMGIYDIVSWCLGYKEQKLELKEMTKLNNELSELQHQDSALTTTINNLILELSYESAEIMNHLNNAAAADYIADIQTSFGGGDHHGLKYYSQAGANYENHVPGYDSVYMAGMLHNQLLGFNDETILSPHLDNDFNFLYLMICPVLPMDSSCLLTFAKVLSLKAAISPPAADSSDRKAFIMNNYLLLESYFFQLLNFQYQAVTVKTNAIKSVDSLQSQNYLMNTVWPVLRAETDMFLQAARYLLVNIADYRSASRWTKDMQFSAISMAPNPDMFDAMARAQFRAAVLYQALNEPRDAVWGNIVVPANFCSSTPSVQVGAGSSLPQEEQVFKGMLPYTVWNGSGTATYDHNWGVYSYNLPAGDGSGEMAISVNPVWPHLSQGPGFGTITPLWYNPGNPAETSAVKTDSCTIQFASFCLSWQWGSLMSDYLTSSGVENRILFGDLWPGNPDCPFCGVGDPINHKPMTPPFIAQFIQNEQRWFNVQQNGIRSFGQSLGSNINAPFHYQLQVDIQAYSSGQEFLYDQITLPVSIPAVPPNGGFSMYASYTAGLWLNPWPSTLQHVNFKTGSNVRDGWKTCNVDANVKCSDNSCYVSNGDVTDVNQIGGSGMGISPPQGPGQYSPGFQYWFFIVNSNVTTNATIQVNMNAQIVFTGYIPVF